MQKRRRRVAQEEGMKEGIRQGLFEIAIVCLHLNNPLASPDDPGRCVHA